MMSKKLNLIFLLLILLLTATCIDTIDFEKPGTIKDSITIQGKLTIGNPSHIRVTISSIFDFENTQRFIDAKYVHLIDQEDNILDLPSRIQGIYEMEIPADHPTF